MMMMIWYTVYCGDACQVNVSNKLDIDQGLVFDQCEYDVFFVRYRVDILQYIYISTVAISM